MKILKVSSAILLLGVSILPPLFLFLPYFGETVIGTHAISMLAIFEEGRMIIDHGVDKDSYTQKKISEIKEYPNISFNIEGFIVDPSGKTFSGTIAIINKQVGIGKTNSGTLFSIGKDWQEQLAIVQIPISFFDQKVCMQIDDPVNLELYDYQIYLNTGGTVLTLHQECLPFFQAGKQILSIDRPIFRIEEKFEDDIFYKGFSAKAEIIPEPKLIAELKTSGNVKLVVKWEHPSSPYLIVVVVYAFLWGLIASFLGILGTFLRLLFK